MLSKATDQAKALLSKATDQAKALLSEHADNAVVVLSKATDQAKALLCKDHETAKALLSKATMTAEVLLARVKRLEGIIPICSYCKKIRGDQNSWKQLEEYLSEYSDAWFSHTVCPDCMEKM